MNIYEIKYATRYVVFKDIPYDYPLQVQAPLNILENIFSLACFSLAKLWAAAKPPLEYQIGIPI